METRIYVSCIVNLPNSPKVTKGMKIAIEDVGTDQNFVITHSSDRFPISKGIEAVGLWEFLRWVTKLN